MKKLLIFGMFLLFVSSIVGANEKKIMVFIALADNASQGIVPVPKAIGNGDDPEKNLYWGTADGLKGFFDKSKFWKMKEKKDTPDGNVLRVRVYENKEKNVLLTAKAYKGTAIKSCIIDFEAALSSGGYDLVVYIGHNGLMDFSLPLPTKGSKTTDCMVLCCKSEVFFKGRIEATGSRPILLTQQLMYPGSFLLDAAARSWLDGKNCKDIRNSASLAYAENQKITQKSALTIFSVIEEKK